MWCVKFQDLGTHLNLLEFHILRYQKTKAKRSIQLKTIKFDTAGKFRK